ncbi:MAG: hypothetical protein KIT46_04480 [Anaerolineales bacterium]|nr:hypothetical protein [Anaerolineales bacterium]MCW5855286.1 hypothetical protein [Anaerolineales bacterium]
MSRSIAKALRVLVDGYEMSGYARSLGPLTWNHEWARDEAVGVEMYAYLANQVTLSIGQLNVAFDTTPVSGPHEVFAGGEGEHRLVMAAIGRGGLAPAAGDPAFVGEFMQGNYLADPGQTGQTLTVQMDFASSNLGGLQSLYAIPWGVLLQPLATVEAGNEDPGVDNPFTGAATNHGGYMLWMLADADDEVELKLQDADTNEDAEFADLASSGPIAAGPAAGIVPLARGTTVERYTRPQVVLGQATYARYALAFVRSFGQ